MVTPFTYTADSTVQDVVKVSLASFNAARGNYSAVREDKLTTKETRVHLRAVMAARHNEGLKAAAIARALETLDSGYTMATTLEEAKELLADPLDNAWFLLNREQTAIDRCNMPADSTFGNIMDINRRHYSDRYMVLEAADRALSALTDGRLAVTA